MIEDNIRNLRRAAKYTSPDEDEEIWCVIAGNYTFIDEIVYKAISSNGRVQILFREHVIQKEGRLNKKFDFVMLKGLTNTINHYKTLSNNNGASFIQITPSYVNENPYLMVLVAPDNVMKRCISTLLELKTKMSILIESESSYPVEVEIDSSSFVPAFMRTKLNSIVNISDIVVLTLLLAVKGEDDVEKVQTIATSNRIFVIDFNDIKMEEKL